MHNIAAAVTELCSFLRKSSRPLRHASLATLDTIVVSHSSLLIEADIVSMLAELTPLVTDADLHLSHLALQLRTSTVRSIPVVCAAHSARRNAKSTYSSPVVSITRLRSPIIADIFGELVRQDVPELNFDVLIGQLLALANDSCMSKHAVFALAQAVGVCCTQVVLASQRDAMVATFIAQLCEATAPLQYAFALQCLGEIGRQSDLSAHNQLLVAVTAGFLGFEEVKAAAAFALGNVTAGNLPSFVPHMLSKLKDSHEYLMLSH